VAQNMATFLGQYQRSLDDKGRLAIPAGLRAALGPGAVLTRSFDHCLCIYPAARWESLARAIQDLPEVSPEARSLARSLFSSAVPCVFDRQGRLTVPAFLREHADLRVGAVILGINDRVELWSREAWIQEQARLEAGGPALARALSL
jgi:MraZ protein